MRIWIDADATPRPVKEIVFRASERLGIPVVLVANRAQQIPRSRLVTLVRVDAGMDVADDHIAANCAQGDLVITADLPLAAEAVARGAVVIEPRGEVLTAENVRERLSMRDFLTELRAADVPTGGPPPFDAAARQRFANALDRLLTAMHGGG